MLCSYVVWLLDKHLFHQAVVIWAIVKFVGCVGVELHSNLVSQKKHVLMINWSLHQN